MVKYKKVYIHPLPVKLIYYSNVEYSLPELVPHNVISWARFGYCYFKNLAKISRSVCENFFWPFLEPALVEVAAGSKFWVRLETDTHNEHKLSRKSMFLWNNGFFGKGTLSRSEPTWYERTSRRLHLVEKYTEGDLSSEEVTALRRAERNKFKQWRQEQEEKQLLVETQISELLEQGSSGSARMVALQKELEELKQRSGRFSTLRKFRNVAQNRVSLYPEITEMRAEDAKMIEGGRLKNVEVLELMPEEALFLHLLGAVEVGNVAETSDLYEVCCQAAHADSGSPENMFLLRYVVYHHFRARGWCVRSGIKFGTHFLVYQRGPPFSHAEYCVQVSSAASETRDFVQLNAVNRVVGGVRKKLVFCYVEAPTQDEYTRILRQIGRKEATFAELLRRYTVSCVQYQRWLPSRNRD